MKKILALCTCLAALTTAYAQKPVFKYPFETEPKTFPDVLVMPHASGKTALLLKNNKKIDYLLLGSDFKVLSSFTHPQAPDKTIYTTSAIPAGYIYNGQKLYNFIYDENGRGGKTAAGKDVLLMDVIDFGQKSNELTVKHTFATGEKVVNAFTFSNTYYILSVPQEGNAISVCYIDSTLNKTVRTYPLSVSDISPAYQMLDNVLRRSSVVYPDRENSAEAAGASIKILPQTGNKIIILSDQKESGPVLAVIDLANNKMDLRQPAMDELCFHTDKGSRVMSTVSGNYLFAGSACKQKLEIAVYDYTTGKLVKKYESAKDDASPAIAMGGLNSEGYDAGKKKNEKLLDNTGSLIKAIGSGNGMIRVMPMPSQYLLTVGSFKGGTLPFPGIVVPDMPAPDYKPPFHHLNYGMELDFTKDYTVSWFRSVLDNNFVKVKQNLKPAPADKLRDVLSMEEKLPKSVAVFSVGGVSYYPWYESETQQFTIRTIK